MTIFNLLRTATLVYLATATFSANSNSYEWELLGPGDADQVTSLSVLENGNVYVGTDIGGIYTSSDMGDSWKSMNQGLNNLDITTKVIQDINKPSILYVGTRGGLYKSTNYGKSWVRQSNGLPEIKKYSLSGSIGSVLIDPFDSNIIYVALGYRPSSDGTQTVKNMKWKQAIYKSTDAGESWQILRAFTEPSKVTQLLHSPIRKNTLYAATSSGLYFSKDSAKSWKKILSKNTLTIAIDPDSPDIVYAACDEDGIFRTINNGISWQSINTGLSFFDYRTKFKNRYSVITIDPHNKNILYTINSTWGLTGGLYKSNDSGDNWTLVSGSMPESWLKTSRRMNDIAISINRHNEMYLGSSRYIYFSSDLGSTWQQKISKKLDNGWTHRGINVFGQTRITKADPKDNNIIYIGTADHKILKSVNGGKSWNLLLNNDKDANYVWDISICPIDETVVNIVTSDNDKNICFMRSKDKGESWSKNCNFNEKSKWKDKIRAAQDNCNELLLSTYNHLYKSIDAGTSWKVIDCGINNLKILTVEYDPDRNSVYYIGTNNGFYTSYDAGATWKSDKSTSDLIVTSIHKQGTETGALFIGTQMSSKRPAELYKSTDNGMTWHKVIGNLRRYVSSITTLPSNQSIIYASTLDDNYHDESKGAGIFKSTDRGNTWERIDLSLPVYRAYNISTSTAHPNSVFLSTNGSGTYIYNQQ